MLMTVVDSVDD